jgi:hypothetical protein
MQRDLFNRIGHNGGPPLEAATPSPSWLLTMAEAQARADVRLRPSYLQRYSGTDSPKRLIVGEMGPAALGAWVLLECGHPKDVRDWYTATLIKRKRPTHARCGCCRERIKPDDRLLAEVERLKSEP